MRKADRDLLILKLDTLPQDERDELLMMASDMSRLRGIEIEEAAVVLLEAIDYTDVVAPSDIPHYTVPQQLVEKIEELASDDLR